MDRPGNDHTKWIKADKERKISYDIAYMQNQRKKKIQVNLFTKHKQIHRHRKQTWVTKGEAGGG